MSFPTATAGQIRTQRLLLEPLRPEFAPALFPKLNDWQVMRWLSGPPWPYQPDDMQAWIAQACRLRCGGRSLDLAITLSGEPIGCIGVTGIGFDPVLGYWLARPFWGHGFMTEAASAFVDGLFAQGHAFVASGVLLGNAASLRVQEKLGFRVVNERYIEARPHRCLMPSLDTVLGRERRSQLRPAA